MNIIISNSSGEPIYEQIASQIKAQILTGELSAGAMLPSMRNLALELHISLITTKRAYEELERDGFIESYTGKSSFVKEQNIEFIKEESFRQIENLLSQAVSKAKICQIPLKDLTDILTMIYQE